MPRWRPSPRAAAFAATAGAAGFLLWRLAGDVGEKPLFEDEAVAGLIAARPAGEILATTLWDRGGAPLHFLLAHVAFALDASPAALRWLSVVFALAAVVVTYDLGRRLAGRTAGVAAAIVAAGSGMLAVYGSFGRMYALLAFAGALAADLFVRALAERTAAAAAAAAAAAWLLPAVHPYGGVVVALEALVALALWRGRPLRPALPVLAVALLTLPFALADLRLAERFEVGSQSQGRLATPQEAWSQLVDALRGFAGGEGALFALFLALAAAGVLLLARRRPAFVAWALLSLAAPPVASVLVRTGRAPDLSPRHLAYALPLWAAFVGVAVAWLALRTPAPVRVAALAALAALAAASPPGIHDPRTITYTAALGTEASLAAPADWLRGEIERGDVLYPYASVFLAALPASGAATALPRAQVQSVRAAVDGLEYPVGSLFVAVPTGTTPVGPVAGARRFDRWLLVRRDGPFADAAALLAAAGGALADARAALRGPAPDALVGWFALNETVLCTSLATLGADCVRA